MNPAQIKKMMQEAQKLQANLDKEQKKLEKKEYTKTLGGGITIVMNGKKEVLSIDLKPEVLDPEDKEFVEDLIKSAINQLHQEIDTEYDSVVGGLTQGMPF